MAGTDLAPQPDRTGTARRRRLVWSAVLTAGVVVGATVMVPSYGDDAGDHSGSLNDRYDATVTSVRASSQEGSPADVDAHLLEHLDPATKNAISRSAETGADTQDPTSNAEKLSGIRAVAEQRNEPQPEIVPVAARPGRDPVPHDRYAMASAPRPTSSPRTAPRCSAATRPRRPPRPASRPTGGSAAAARRTPSR